MQIIQQIYQPRYEEFISDFDFQNLLILEQGAFAQLKKLRFKSKTLPLEK
ncbi:unnamed protein product [Paramecium pentaurelia]|uniref:Uncharacterized protein n=1 Tax=Paramecium pentaurelia TaxID=43138 RepID=A0A8S1TGE4_9CILI|nr:unnamed protein product [Paramecium pentaurelia]